VYFSSSFRIYELFATCLLLLRHLLPVSFRVVGVVLVARETKGDNSISRVVQNPTGPTVAVLLQPLVSFPVGNTKILVPSLLPDVACIIGEGNHEGKPRVTTTINLMWKLLLLLQALRYRYFWLSCPMKNGSHKFTTIASYSWMCINALNSDETTRTNNDDYIQVQSSTHSTRPSLLLVLVFLRWWWQVKNQSHNRSMANTIGSFRTTELALI